MSNDELISNIRSELNNIHPGKGRYDIQFSIQNIIRNVNRLVLNKHKNGKLLSRHAADMMQLYAGEIKFLSLKIKEGNAEIEKLSESFFKSLEIIKSEMLPLLDAEAGN